MAINISNKDNKIYVVLAAPNSASSFIAKALHDAGVNMGTFGVSGNKTVYYEDLEWRGLNRKIMKESGGRLQDPATKEAIDAVDISEDLKTLLEKDRGQFWGWKDPRNTLTAHKIVPNLDGDVYLICCFRKPSKVINSYKHKKGFGREFTKDILDRYNQGILDTVKEFCEL